MGEVVDGEYQKYIVEPGAYIREHFFGKYPELLELVEHLLRRAARASCSRGGHDPDKVYAAYKAAVEHKGTPTVILAKTIKGYGLGEAGEGRNITHQQKKLNEEELREFRNRFGIPISDEEVAEAAVLQAGRRQPGDEVPARAPQGAGRLAAQRGASSARRSKSPRPRTFKEFFEGSGDQRRLDDDGLRRHADAAAARTRRSASTSCRSFPTRRARSAWSRCSRQFGIYSNVGQLYEPVDAKTLLRTTARRRTARSSRRASPRPASMSSFIAAGTAYATHGVPTDSVLHLLLDVRLPADRRPDLGRRPTCAPAASCSAAPPAAPRSTARACSTRTATAMSWRSTVPNLRAYDPAFAYELAVIIQDGMRRMYEDRRGRLLLHHALQRELPDAGDAARARREGILKGMYKFRPAPLAEAERQPKVHLLGSGPILREALRAQEILAEQFGVAADVWSVTSYKELRRDALDVRALEPAASRPSEPRKSYVETAAGEGGRASFVAASDYMQARAGDDRALGARRPVRRWAPTASAAARPARRCAASSRSTPSASPSPPWSSSPAGGIDRSVGRRGRSDELGVDPEKLDPLSVAASRGLAAE